MADGSVAPASPDLSASDQPSGNEAFGLTFLAEGVPAGGYILAARSEAQATRLAASAVALLGTLSPVLLPGWDCLPFDRASPSHGIMGQRMRVAGSLGQRGSQLLIASVETLVQLLPTASSHARLTIETGQEFTRAELQADFDRFGYVVEEEARQPGQIAVRGAVIDVYPADGGRPARLRCDADTDTAIRVAQISLLDPETQRSGNGVEHLALGPASELVFDSPQDRPPGLEHMLPALADRLVSVFDLMPQAVLLLAPECDERLASYFSQIDEARATRIALARAAGETLPADGLYLDANKWEDIRRRHRARTIEWPIPRFLPRFRGSRDAPVRAGAFVAEQAEAGLRIGISGRRLARVLDLEGEKVQDWPALLARPPGTVAFLADGIPEGFVAEEAVVLADDDVLPPRRGLIGHEALFDVEMRPGDAVIHLDHGMARLDGIETVEDADCVVLGFAGQARKLVPCLDMDRIWRYGAGTDGVALDRADGSTWERRRAGLSSALEQTAAALVEQAQARAARLAPSIRPPRRAMERFADGFAYAPTPDQAAAFDEIAADLARPHPMDRLLCGDVGFGKTEAALRAAAAVALSGRQVAILAPTTVLVRQHLATFRRRLAAVGIEVEALSRLTKAADARAIRERLSDGSLRVVIGTQALAGKDVRFAELALVVIDEEQRFGAKDKAALSALRDGVHSLVLTATPIPRTLEGAMIGMQDLSVLTTPPARRQPVRTAVMPCDEAVIRTALMREHARGGQSFCVCPRIEDLEAVAGLLGRLVPGLSIVTLHGRMRPDAVDAAIVGFAEGHGDVLLATQIIESGVDIPRANTMLIWRADRFGLAQLHQLRGRVGRGRAQGSAWLFTDPAAPPGPTGAKRLAALAANDGLGSGFAIAARDLDIRGSGDLLGEDQAGHAKLLGVDLTRHLLAREMARARGEVVDEEWRPTIALGLSAYIPETYMHDAASRIALHARLARLDHAADLADDLADRFGPLPDPVRYLIAQSELRAACFRLDIAALEVGPAAAAADMRDEPDEVPGLHRKNKRLLLREATTSNDERLKAARTLVRLVARARSRQGGRGAKLPSPEHA